jgi:hypothetical protein
MKEVKMKKSLLSVGVASLMLTMFATGCTTSNNAMKEIQDHFNNPPARYCIPVKGKEAEVAELDKKLAKTSAIELITLTKIVAQRAKLLEGRCKRLVPSPAECGAVATAAAITIDTVGIVMEDLTYRSSSMGKAYISVYDKSEALKIASQKLSEKGADAASVVASLPEDMVRDLASSTSSILAILDPTQTVVTLQNIGSEAVKSVGELKNLIPTLTTRVTDLAKPLAEKSKKIAVLSTKISQDLMKKKVNPFKIKAEVEKILNADPVVIALKKEMVLIQKEIDCIKKEGEQAKILIEYGIYIGKSCNYLLAAMKETNALNQAAQSAVAKIGNAIQNND